MKRIARKYCKNIKELLLIFFCIAFLMSACITQYRLVTNPVPYQPETPYTSFTVMPMKIEEPHNSIVNLLSTGLEDNFHAIGLKKDSLDPELLLIIRWEKHLIGLHSSASDTEVSQTYRNTNPVYSPFENTSDKLKNRSSDNNVRYYDEESFYRIQAIDAIKNELVWSIKIYPSKPKGLRAESVPLVVRDLTRSFARVQFNNSKSKSDGNNHN